MGPLNRYKSNGRTSARPAELWPPVAAGGVGRARRPAVLRQRRALGAVEKDVARRRWRRRRWRRAGFDCPPQEREQVGRALLRARRGVARRRRRRRRRLEREVQLGLKEKCDETRRVSIFRLRMTQSHGQRRARLGGLGQGEARWLGRCASGSPLRRDA